MDNTDEEFLDNYEDIDLSLCCSAGEEISNETYTSNTPQPEKKRKKYKQVRPKVSTEWTHDDIVKLIAAIEERPTLWDISSSMYKLPKTSAWQDIADGLEQHTADDCKAKWSNLRVSFKTNLSKSRKYKSGSAAGASIAWKYFKSMMFLEANEASETAESITSMTLPSEDSNLSPATHRLPKPQKLEKRIQSVPPQSSSEVFKEMAAKAICSIAEKTKEKNQFDVFGNHVATELQSLPLTKALFAKRKLARALVDIMDEVETANQNSGN